MKSLKKQMKQKQNIWCFDVTAYLLYLILIHDI